MVAELGGLNSKQINSSAKGLVIVSDHNESKLLDFSRSTFTRLVEVSGNKKRLT